LRRKVARAQPLHRQNAANRRSARFYEVAPRTRVAIHSRLEVTMRAARLHAYGKPLSLDEVPTPRPGPGQVLVKIAGAGFCHTDLHVIDGDLRLLPKLPLTLGHENAGFVAAVGAGVQSVREGDAVAVFGGWGDGRCDACVTGHEQLCERPEWVGLSQWDGGYADYLLVPRERYLIKLERLDPRDAAPLTDAALTPYRAVKKALPELPPDHFALVIGLGGLGQYGLKLLKLLTGSPVIAVDVAETKREAARALGATHALDGRDPELVQKIIALTGGHGVGAAFDFVGSDATLAAAIASTRSLGKVSQVGLAGGSVRMKVLENARFEVAVEATLWGTLKELREVIALAESGRLTPIATEHVALDQIGDAYTRLKAGRVSGRLVIVP
jgi:propanol-preferring alcohol dehydrogenase